MYYQHEQTEHRPNAHPMCTTLPSWCPGAAECFEEYLQARNLDAGLAQDNGWYVSKDAGDHFPRIVIPAVTHKAGHVYWQARDITGKAFLRYQSPKGPRHEALVKVIPDADPRDYLGNVIVEGPMDALAAAMEGYVGYALMGMKPSNATLMHLALLIEDSNDLVTVVCLDRGEIANAIKVSMFLSSQGYQAAVAELPEKDLAQCLPSVRRKFLSQSFRNLFSSKS